MENKEYKKILVYLFNKFIDAIKAEIEKTKVLVENSNETELEAQVKKLKRLTENDIVILANEYIIQELLEHKVKSDKKTITEYFKEKGIKTSDYIAIFEKRCPKRIKYIDLPMPLMIVPKRWRYISKNVS